MGLQSLDKAKLIQVSMDGPNVNWVFFEELRNFRDENDMNKLLPTGSCGLHSIHMTFKTGENSTDWGVKKILKAVYQIFHDSPAQRADCIEVTGSEQFPLPFCGTRWIEDQNVSLRAIEIWITYVKYVDSGNLYQKASDQLAKAIRLFYLPQKIRLH